jgi:hypothetical protein
MSPGAGVVEAWIHRDSPLSDVALVVADALSKALVPAAASRVVCSDDDRIPSSHIRFSMYG